MLPIPSYGCEVWFWDHRVGARATMQAESLHAQFLRRLLGVHRHVHTLIALAWQIPLVSALAMAGGQVQAAFEEP